MVYLDIFDLLWDAFFTLQSIQVQAPDEIRTRRILSGREKADCKQSI